MNKKHIIRRTKQSFFFFNDSAGKEVGGEKMKKYKIGLYIALIMSVMTGIVIYEYFFYRQIPDTLYLEQGEVEKIEFAMPCFSCI